MKIGILCSGGDSPGMNTAIKTVVNMCTNHGIKVVAINGGFSGLLKNDVTPINNDMVKNISSIGGCVIKVSRCPEFNKKESVLKGAAVLKKNKIDGLILIGGNGTYKGGRDLVNYAGVKLIALPGTIDNDLFYTDKTLGFDTAVNNSIYVIDNIMQSLNSNNRCGVFQVMGRDCGHIALNTAVAVNAHALAAKEINSSINSVVKDVAGCVKNGVESPIVVVSEACNFSINEVQKAIEQKLKIETRGTVVGYMQRGGAPSVQDRMLAIQMGILAMELLIAGKHNLAVGIKNNKVCSIPLNEAIDAKPNFDYDTYNKLRSLHNLK